MLWGISETVNARPLPLCSGPLKNLLVEIFWSSRNERKPLSKQKCVLWKCCGVSQKQWMLELSNLCYCVQHLWKLTVRDFWSSRNAPNTPMSPPNGHPLVPQGEWPTWSKPGKWHKWPMQVFINMWHYLQWLFTNMYIHNLITYSCMKSIKMLWGLFLPLTNLLISFHQQSSVLLHQGTTFIYLLGFSYVIWKDPLWSKV